MTLYATRINIPAKYRPAYRLTSDVGTLRGTYYADGSPCVPSGDILPPDDVRAAIAAAPK